MGLPIPKLDDRTFEDLLREARLLISRYAPEWTDHNVHDPGVTFIELFSWLAEMQIYRLNRVTDENYLRFLKLTGLTPYPVQPSRTDITFEEIKEEKKLPAHTPVVTKAGDKDVWFQTEEELELLSFGFKSIRTVGGSKTVDHMEANEKEGVSFFAFGEKPSVGSALELEFDKYLPEKDITITFVLSEEGLPPLGSHGEERERITPSASVAWEYFNGKWNGLTVKKDTTLSLMRSGKITFHGVSSAAKIRCQFVEGQYEIAPLVEKILLNTVSAVQIETVMDEDRGKGAGVPGQKILLKKSPVIKCSQAIRVEGKGSAWEEWHEVEDFESSGPGDTHYVFDPEKGEVTFGNGLNGRLPLESQKIKATYKITSGLKGNILKGQQFFIKGKGVEGIHGINMQGAKGGKPAEALEDAKNRAERDFRTSYQAVTSEDYEKLTLSTPGLRVARARAIPNYSHDYPCFPVPGAVTVVVVPGARGGTENPVPGEGFLRTVFRHLDKHRLITTDLYVIPPEYVKVSVTLRVRLKKKSSPGEVEKRVRSALAGFLNPLTGGPDKNGWPFGRAVFPSEMYQIIDTVEGVEYATDAELNAEGAGTFRKAGDTIKISRVALVYSGEHRMEFI